jgi:hypothetical protein
VVTPRVNDPRVDEVTGELRRLRSTIIPPWAGKSPKVAEATSRRASTLVLTAVESVARAIDDDSAGPAELSAAVSVEGGLRPNSWSGALISQLNSG